MYTQPDGRPVGFCLTEAVGPEYDLFTGRRDDLTFASWTEDGVARILIGWEDVTRLTGIQETVIRGLEL